MVATQTIHLELYAAPLKRALARAQAFADQRNHAVVTVHHLLRSLLEAGCGSEPSKRAGVDPQALLAKARAATEQLPGNASSPSYLDSELLATMGRAEALMRELGREAVDIQCMYVALGARKHVSAMIGLATWSDSERTGSTSTVQQASGSTSAPLAAALKEDSKVLSELAQEIATACGAPLPPMEVSVTLQRMISILAPPGAPVYLRVEFDNARRMTAQREGIDTRFVIVEWAPPAGIALVILEGAERSSTEFSLAASNRWMSGDDELFGALRKAILGFYPEATKPSGTRTPSADSDSEASKAVAAMPSLPARATIESYEVADAVGLLELENGEQVRFGRSACKGFEPVVGASVIVEEVTSYPRGWRAKTVSLDPADTHYDSLLSARDREMGLPSRTIGSAEAAATARQLALITVLLREPLPEGTLALRQWAAERGFPRDGIDVKTERDLELSIAGGSVLTYAGRSPLPKDGLGTRNLPKDFDYGCSFIGLGTGLPGVDRQMRLMRAGAARDCWAMDGSLRHLSRLVRVLADGATGVVIHRAGDLVVPVEEFVRMLGNLEDPECRPFAAWLDVGIAERNGEKVYATFGMDAFGLPDVLAPVNADDRWSRSRRHEAVLHACYRMVRANREFSAGETLRVPLRTKSGAWPDEVEGNTAAFTYSIVDDGSSLRLVPGDEIDPAVQWRDRGDAIAVNAYQALFERGLADAIPSDLVRDVSARNPDTIPHSVDVRARHDGRGFMIVTNGFGRIPQREVERGDCAHIEVAAWVPTDLSAIVELVGTLASNAHSSIAGSWKPADTLAAPNDELGIAGFVLADGGAVEMGGGPRVRLMILVPLSPDEYERVRGGGAAAWLTKNEVDERRWAPFVARVN